jgi:hypothetical protein
MLLIYSIEAMDIEAMDRPVTPDEAAVVEWLLDHAECAVLD